MPNRRTYTDEQLTLAVADGSCWADVLEALWKGRSGNPRWPRKRALDLALDIAHLDRYPTSMIVARAEYLPFTDRQAPATPGRLGLSAAISWFLNRGYNPSIPVEPCFYDLVVESDDGLQRVQVKTTGSKSRDGYYRVRVGRGAYEQGAVSNANGKFRPRPYPAGSLDYFFIASGDGVNYLIPQHVIGGRVELSLTRKYVAFVV
jgi:hypothetical protein